MDTNLPKAIANLRLLVGFLGEKDQFTWWRSSFFTSSSSAFLSPLFHRTQLLAQCNGVTRAAALVHDDRIGVGHVYHLFRLPEDLEQGIHQALQELESGYKIPKAAEQGLEHLRESALQVNKTGTGPVRVGAISDLYSIDAWKQVAGQYWNAFQEAREIFPYFADV